MKMNNTVLDLNTITECKLDGFENIVVYGFGPAGKVNGWVIDNELGIKEYYFCDRDDSKHNLDCSHPVISVSDASKLIKPAFVVGFYNNDKTKIQSAIELLQINNINFESIFLIDMETDYYNNIYAVYLEKFIDKTIRNREPREIIDKVKEIVFLSGGFNKEKEKNGGGGPIGVICMQKKTLGEKFENVDLSYPYFESNDEYENPINRFPYMTGAVQAAYEIAKNKNNAIYIANDVFSAFGIYKAGKPYRIIFHAQGDNVNEMLLWGENLTEEERFLIKRIEKVAFENANMVSFPSKGAHMYFDKCFDESIKYNIGRPMFNTIVDAPNIDTIKELQKDNDCTTFLSIGQMTELKGIDLVPDFLHRYYNVTKKKIRWIVVSGGVNTIENRVKESVNFMKEQGVEIEYIGITERINHSRVLYLFEISDVYIMLHRLSIFDFSTLEAMVSNKPIILSDIPGNREFNVEGNILLYNDGVDMKDVQKYIDDKKNNGDKNKRVYEKYFSIAVFMQLYSDYLSNYIKEIEG